MEGTTCSCPQDIPNHLRAPNIQDSGENVHFQHLVGTLVFKPTLVGTTTRQIFRLRNDSKETQSYSTQRNPNTNPIYHVFDFKISKTSVASGEHLECTIIYSPQVTHQKNVDYLQILDKDFKLYEVCLKGDCIGPTVNISTKTLYFYDTSNNKGLMHKFEIKNTSDVPVIFQIDINEDDSDQEVFKIDKIRDTLKPFEYRYITVRFAATKNGFYCQNLVCMIMNHMPIMIKLIGLHMPNLKFDVHKITLRRFPQTHDETHGYSGYMHDSVKTTTHKPPFSLSVNYLDFGRVECHKKRCNSRVLVTSLTNHLPESIEVVWINDNNGVFSILPEDVIIPPGESVMYECRFKPNLPDQLYSKLLTANVHWTHFRSTLRETEFIDFIDVPLTMTLKVLGHSFPENKVWLPRVDVNPNVIILPPCMPMVASYTTFLLKSSGHLPTLFKFLPPKKSNFLLKPMAGIIHNFQIVVAQLQPDLNDKKAYVELWGVELNGRTEDCLPFYLKGYSEYAALTVGNNNVVAFSTVYPGCQDILNVMVKNISTHFIKYNFLIGNNSYINITHPKGELASNESLFLQWYFTGNLHGPETSVIECEIRAVQNSKLITGHALNAHVTVYAKCTYSELCATPNGVDFGLIRWGTKHSTEFYLFNFGESTIHFELVPKDAVKDIEELTILPTKGNVSPREKKRIIAHIKALKIGQQEVQIMYRVRLNKVSDSIIDDGKVYKIFNMQYECSYATLQIEDICSNNFGSLFSKIILWDMFNIDKINKILKSICHDETETVEMIVPDYELGEADFFADLLVRNKTQFRTELKIKRLKLCNCPLVCKSKGMSLRKHVYDCIHRQMIKCTLSDEWIEANLTQKLRLDVKYLERGLTKVMYIIHLSDNRKINIYIKINVLPENVTMASNYSHHLEFNLKSIYIGERHPPAQAFPLYNNSAFVIDYHLDITPLDCLNFNHDFEIFKCLNPIGTISPFTSHDILFNFVPIEARKYNVAVLLTMGENKLSLQISGEGVATLDPHMHDIKNTLPCSSKADYTKNPIELSADHLILEPILVWSTMNEMFFIHNQTSDRIIGYSWQSCTVEGIVHAEAVYGKGVLQPQESQAVIIRINSFDQPCRIRLQMICKLLDHTQHMRYQESVIAYNCKQEELAGQFTITEDGVFYPKNDVIILPKAETFFTTLTISLFIVSICDRDLWLPSEKQLQQSPQHSLHINTVKIFEKYFQPLIPKQSRLSISHVNEVNENEDVGNPRTQQHCCKINITKDEIQLYNLIMECLISDVVFSEMFCKIVDATNNSPQPYYLQFKMDDDPSIGSTLTIDNKEKDRKDLEKRMNLVKNYLNRPQIPFLAHIFNELISDSVHQIFELGPQVKNRPHKLNIYESAKSKFTCLSCKCDK